MARVSAIVITKNEERHIRACLETLSWADEIVVLDSFSTDRTTEISREFTEKVFQKPFVDFPSIRNAAIQLASEQWVFFLDADERATRELVAEVKETIAGTTILDGYFVPRRNIILGKWIRHAGWFPDYQLRLFQRDKGRYDQDKQVHELVLLKGNAGYLKSYILHYNYDTIGQLITRQSLYSTYESRTLFASGLHAKPQNFILQPLREFNRRYIQEQGYKDGFHGLFLCLVMAWYNLLVYSKLARMGHLPKGERAR